MCHFSRKSEKCTILVEKVKYVLFCALLPHSAPRIIFYDDDYNTIQELFNGIKENLLTKSFE
jgi:hypothetical protein